MELFVCNYFCVSVRLFKIYAALKYRCVCYSPDMHVSSASGLCINSIQVLELTLSQSFSTATFTQYQYFVPPGTHYCWVARCGFKAYPRLLHMTSDTGIESQTP